MTWPWPALGAALLALLAWDVHATVFVPRGAGGPLTGRLYRRLWQLWLAAAPREGKSRGRFLALLGPLLVPLTLVTWGALLWLGFALVFLPWAGSFTGSGAAQLSPWQGALYLSGYDLTTLGVGDVTPRGFPLRLLGVMEAGWGFGLFSVSISYLLSVYGALRETTALALDISWFVGRARKERPEDLLGTLQTVGDEDELASWLLGLSGRLAGVVQAEGQYPLLNYFHTRPDRALPVALGDALHLVTLCRALLDPARFPVLARGTASQSVLYAARTFFEEVGKRSGAPEPPGPAGERREAYLRSRKALTALGVPLRPDQDAWPRFEALRRKWDAPHRRALEQFGYAELHSKPLSSSAGRA